MIPISFAIIVMGVVILIFITTSPQPLPPRGNRPRPKVIPREWED
jgi:hypothetical protein